MIKLTVCGMLYVQMTSCGSGSATAALSQVNSTSSGGTQGAAPAPPLGVGQPPTGVFGMLHVHMSSSALGSASVVRSHVNSTGSGGGQPGTKGIHINEPNQTVRKEKPTPAYVGKGKAPIVANRYKNKEHGMRIFHDQVTGQVTWNVSSKTYVYYNINIILLY